MSYEYITNNNLFEKQNYMYSKYYGKQFLMDYIESRKLKKKLTYLEGQEDTGDFKSVTYHNLQQIHIRLQKPEENNKYTAIDELGQYVKSFEVRKRLYTEYRDWKPIEGASFEEYESYLLFADCLLCAFALTGCLKFYSCVLKVDDTLLSLQDKLNSVQGEHLQRIIDKELEYFQSLLEKQGIQLGV